MWKPCEHNIAKDHIVRTDRNGRVWKCSCCGNESYWTESHSSFGNIECGNCGFAEVVWVACSDACATALNGGSIHSKDD